MNSSRRILSTTVHHHPHHRFYSTILYTPLSIIKPQIKYPLRTFATPASSAGRVTLARTRRPVKAAIEITPAAIVRLKELLGKRPDAVGVKLGVKTRGCNGVSYTMNYTNAKGKFDEEVNQDGIKIYIEPNALLKITGTIMDWKEDDLSAEFTFANPNAKAVCGCGESFNV